MDRASELLFNNKQQQVFIFDTLAQSHPSFLFSPLPLNPYEKAYAFIVSSSLEISIREFLTKYSQAIRLLSLPPDCLFLMGQKRMCVKSYCGFPHTHLRRCEIEAFPYLFCSSPGRIHEKEEKKTKRASGQTLKKS